MTNPLHDALIGQQPAPAHPFLIAADGAITSYADIDRESARLANALVAAGVAPGDRVAVVESEARAREITDYRERQRRDRLAARGAASGAGRSLAEMMRELKEGAGRKEFPLVVKGDVQGSVEAIGGALEKQNLGTIVGWVCDELPDDKPRHLLGISEPDDIFTAVEAGADTFDCVAPTRLARRGGVYTLDGRLNLTNARFKRDFKGVDEEFGGYVSENYSRAYIHHLLKAKEFLAGTLCTIHNVEFMVRLVDNIRAAINGGYYEDYRDEFLGRYYAASKAR